MKIVAIDVLEGAEAERIYCNRMKILARLDAFLRHPR